MPYIESDDVERALRQHVAELDESDDQPSASYSGEHVDSEGRRYVVLRNSYRVLAVYGVVGDWLTELDKPAWPAGVDED